jgi:hypothetical protein
MAAESPDKFQCVLIPLPILPEINISPNDFGFHSIALKLGGFWKRDFEIYSPAKVRVVEGLKAEARLARMNDQP